MFCDNWQLTLNVKKTKTMVVQQNTSQVSPFIDFKGDEMRTKNQVNFFEGGSINKGEMVHASIS
jgi:hypothetical protein